MPMSREEFTQLLDETANAEIEGGSTPTAGRGRGWVPLLAGAAVAVVVAGGAFAVKYIPGQDDGGGPAVADPGCSRSVEPIAEATQFTPFGERRTQTSTLEVGQMLLKDAVALKDGQDVNNAPAIVGDEQLAGIVESESGMVTALYGVDAWAKLTASEDLGDFYRAGGLMLVTFPATAGQDVGTQTLKDEPDRATSVAVGDSTGALSWADPMDDAGLRPHVLQWTSGAQNLRVVAVRAPGQLVEAGRGLECALPR